MLWQFQKFDELTILCSNCVGSALGGGLVTAGKGVCWVTVTRYVLYLYIVRL